MSGNDCAHSWISVDDELPLRKGMLRVGAVRVAYTVDNGDGDGSWHYETDIACFGSDGWYNESGVGRFKNALKIRYWHMLPSTENLE